jgi:hypothetical protein
MRRGHASRVKSGLAVHRCRRSGYRSRPCAGLCIVVETVLTAAAGVVGLRNVVVAVLAAAAIPVLVAHQAHPATCAV